MTLPAELVDRFLAAASVPLQSHGSGTSDGALALLAAYPALASATLNTAAVSGNAAHVRALLEASADRATEMVQRREGPHGWDALTWCCFSRLLRDDRARHHDFMAVARALLEAGASANTGFADSTHGPTPQHESVLYGAAGVAYCAPLVTLLLVHGADPNDSEVPYHAAEWYAHDVIEALLASPIPLSRATCATLLLRKADWHDLHGVTQLLAHGVDPNECGPWPFTPFQQALRRDNALPIIEAMLDAGADPLAEVAGTTALAIAAWHGRLDALQLFSERGVPLADNGLTAVAVDCTFGAVHGARARLSARSDVRDEFMRRLPEFTARCAGNGNTAALGALLQFAPSVDLRWTEGDAYWEIAPGSTALHVAAWRAQHSAVRLLIDAGADVHATDGSGHSPLRRAIDACTRAWWRDQRSPASVAALLRAGASRGGIPLPTGYDEVDRLLAPDGAT